jgi:hypothetical protein
MEKKLGTWTKFATSGSSSWPVARLPGKLGLAIASVWLILLALLAMRHFQVLEEDADETFWTSAPGHILVYCPQCQRQRLIREQDESELAQMCAGGRLLHRHPKTPMLRFPSGRGQIRKA